MEDWPKFLVLGLDAAFVGILYQMYRKEVKDAITIKHAPVYQAQSEKLMEALEQAPGQELSYVCVEGLVNATGPPLCSQYTTNLGVVQRILLIEHRVKRFQGFWSNSRRAVKDVTNTVPFHLMRPISHSSTDYRTDIPAVNVSEILSAEHLADNLTVVYDLYEPTKDNFLSRSIDSLLLGEITKGYQEKELMLRLGTPVIGIGRLCLSADKSLIHLSPCDDGRPYVLTSVSRYEVIRSIKDSAWSLKFFLTFFGGVGIALGGYLLYKYGKKWSRQIDFRRRLAVVRRRRDNREEVESTSNSCVVCLTNRREVIVLDCGHICLCSSCSQELPSPASCPVCRSRVNRFLPVYVS